VGICIQANNVDNGKQATKYSCKFYVLAVMVCDGILPPISSQQLLDHTNCEAPGEILWHLHGSATACVFTLTPAQ
jgi:hypothetical protein